MTISNRKSHDKHDHVSYGDSVYQKSPAHLRALFENTHGLTYSSSGEDYKYYHACLQDLGVDVSGLAETNTAWQKPYLKADFRGAAKRQFNLAKSVFGYSSVEFAPAHPREHTQAGGNITTVAGSWVTRVHGNDIIDPSGLGRYSGVTLQGKEDSKLSIITEYRVCAGSFATASIGSSFAREFEYLREQGVENPKPRQAFLDDLSTEIKRLQKEKTQNSPDDGCK